MSYTTYTVLGYGAVIPIEEFAVVYPEVVENKLQQYHHRQINIYSIVDDRYILEDTKEKYEVDFVYRKANSADEVFVCSPIRYVLDTEWKAGESDYNVVNVDQLFINRKNIERYIRKFFPNYRCNVIQFSYDK